MSCGDPHDVHCREVLDRVYEYIDGEMTLEDCGQVRQHLAECGPCLQEYDLDEALKALVKRSCSDPAPVDLRQRILLALGKARHDLDDRVDAKDGTGVRAD